MTTNAAQVENHSNMLNGVDVDRLFGTVEAIKGNPKLAEFQFRATNRWFDGGHNRTSIKSFYGAGQEDTTRKTTFIYDNNEPTVLLGSDMDANPVEYLLHAMAGCMTTSMVYHAAAHGITIERVESKFEGDLDLQGFLGLDKNVAPGYKNIRATFKVKADASPEELKAFFDYSPVCDTVCRPVTVEKTVEMID